MSNQDSPVSFSIECKKLKNLQGELSTLFDSLQLAVQIPLNLEQLQIFGEAISKILTGNDLLKFGIKIPSDKFSKFKMIAEQLQVNISTQTEQSDEKIEIAEQNNTFYQTYKTFITSLNPIEDYYFHHYIFENKLKNVEDIEEISQILTKGFKKQNKSKMVPNYLKLIENLVNIKTKLTYTICNLTQKKEMEYYYSNQHFRNIINEADINALNFDQLEEDVLKNIQEKCSLLPKEFELAIQGQNPLIIFWNDQNKQKLLELKDFFNNYRFKQLLKINNFFQVEKNENLQKSKIYLKKFEYIKNNLLQQIDQIAEKNKIIFKKLKSYPMQYFIEYNIKYEGYSKYFYPFENAIEKLFKNILHYVKTQQLSSENYDLINEKLTEIQLDTKEKQIDISKFIFHSNYNQKEIQVLIIGQNNNDFYIVKQYIDEIFRLQEMNYQLTPQIITDLQSNENFKNLLSKYNVVQKFNIQKKNSLAILGYSEDLLVVDQKIQEIMKKYDQQDFQITIDDEIVYKLIFRNHQNEISEQFSKCNANLNLQSSYTDYTGQKLIKFKADEDDYPALRDFINNLKSNIKNTIVIQKICCSASQENLLLKQEFQKQLLNEFPIEIITANQLERQKQLHLNLETNYLTFKINQSNFYFGSQIPFQLSLDCILLFIDLYGNFPANIIGEIAKLSGTASDIINVINQFQSRLAKRQKIKLQKLENYITMKKQIDIEKISYGIIQSYQKPMNFPNFLAYFTVTNCLNEFLCNISQNYTKIGITLPTSLLQQQFSNQILSIINYLNSLNFSLNFYCICENEEQVQNIKQILEKEKMQQVDTNQKKNSISAQQIQSYVQQYQNTQQIIKWSYENENRFEEYTEDEQFLLSQAYSQKQDKLYFTKQINETSAVKCEFNFENKTLSNTTIGLNLQVSKYPVVWDIFQQKSQVNHLKIYIDKDAQTNNNNIIDVTNYYKVNFLKNYQKNLITKTKRQIQFIIESKQMKKSQYSWYFSVRDSFQKMDEQNNKIIELAFQKNIQFVWITRPQIDYGYSTLEVNTNDISYGTDMKSKQKAQQQIYLQVIQQLDQSNVEQLAKNYAQLGILKFNLYYESTNMFNLTYFYQVDIKQMCQTNLKTKINRGVKRVLEEQKEEPQIQFEQEDSNCYFYLRGMVDDLNKSAALIYQNFQEQALVEEDFEFPFIIEAQLKSDIQMTANKLKVNVIFEEKKICLKGTQDNLKKLQKLLNQIIYKDLASKMIQYPEEFNQLEPSEKLKLLNLENHNYKEFNQIKQYFLKGLPKAKIVQIQKILNKCLYTAFSSNKQIMNQKYNNNYLSSKLLFHGTRDCNPSKIYEGIDEGFDMRLSQVGMWGKGIYFADISSYSNCYAYSLPPYKQIFLAEVNVGKFINCPPNKEFTRPPQQQNSNLRYDSIEGQSGGANIYIVYQNSQVYPKYLITYQDN